MQSDCLELVFDAFLIPMFPSFLEEKKWNFMKTMVKYILALFLNKVYNLHKFAIRQYKNKN